MKRGDAHIMMWTAPYAVLERAEKDPTLVVPKSPDVYVGFIGFNLRDPALATRTSGKRWPTLSIRTS